MGANSGKFYDQKLTEQYFQDIADSYEDYKNNASVHQESQSNLANTTAWNGMEADTAKNAVKTNETDLLNEILNLQADMVTLQNDIMEAFRVDIDSATNARIEYDALEQIMLDFQTLYLDYYDNTQKVQQEYATLSGNYSKYHSFTPVDSSLADQAFYYFCGANDTTNGFLYECMKALVDFDENVKAMIVERGLDIRIKELTEKLLGYLGVTVNENDLKMLTYQEDQIRKENVEAKKVEAILAQESWTEEDARYLGQVYKKAVENQNTDILDVFYNSMLTNYLYKNEDGQVCYAMQMDWEKTALLEYGLVNYAGVSADSDLIATLDDTASIQVSLSTDIEPLVSVKTWTCDNGVVINWSVSQNGEEILSTQRMIWKDAINTTTVDADKLQERYDALENTEGVQEYRAYLKGYKDTFTLSELESNALEDENFDTLSVYDSTEETKKILGFIPYKDSDITYEYINDVDYSKGYRTNELVNGGEEVQNCYENMTDEQRAIYNYYYATDKEKAEKYLELLTPSLRYQQAQAIYSNMEGHTVTETLYGTIAGLESVSTGIGNAFGVNNDSDGVPMTTVVSYVDQEISSNATGVLKYTYGGAKLLGQAIPGITIGLATGGSGAVVEVMGILGTSAIYGTSAGGNAYSYAANSGYTISEAQNYGIETGVKEGVKTAAMSFMGAGTMKAASTAGWNIVSQAAVTATETAAVEYFDETVVSPHIAANTLHDNSYLDVDYDQALENSLKAGMIAGGFTLASGAIKEIKNGAENKVNSENNTVESTKNNTEENTQNNTLENTKNNTLENTKTNTTDEYLKSPGGKRNTEYKEVSQFTKTLEKTSLPKAEEFITSKLMEKGQEMGLSETTMNAFLEKSGVADLSESLGLDNLSSTELEAMYKFDQSMGSSLEADIDGKIRIYENISEYQYRYENGYFDTENYTLDDIVSYKLVAKDSGHTVTPVKNYDGIINGEYLPTADCFVSDAQVINYVKGLCPDSYLIQTASTLQELADAIAAENPTVNFVAFQNASTEANHSIVIDGGNFGYGTLRTGGPFSVPESMLVEYAKNYSEYCHIDYDGTFVIDNYEKFGEVVLSGVKLNEKFGVYIIRTEVPINGNNIGLPSVENGGAYLYEFVSGGELLSSETETTIRPLSSGISGRETLVNGPVTVYDEDIKITVEYVK